MPEPPAKGRPGLWFETAGEKWNEPLVLLHGFTGTLHTWDALVERLSKRRFLIMPDLPGHGRSAGDAMDLDATRMALANVMANALQRDEKRKVALLGYSLGGRMALDFALKHKERLSCLILESASPGIQDPTERKERRARDDALAADIERRGIEWFVDYWENTPLFAAQKKLGTAVVGRLRRERLSNSAAGIAMSLRSAGAGRMPSHWGDLERIDIPVLLIAGERDEKYRRVGEAMERSLPNGTLAVVDGSGHCVHVERPLAFGDVVEAFLEGRVSRAARRTEAKR
ncbi:MAG: 2-succinyl-6-hydroxy-2,4-cyclohexadiene-1-carboxylate synthase [Thaumarchaeota archaeon]|nr:2-succinyl-6-hydroxy-2,4-cyclohexadiene-1-carboxylate synthase [Nitrososphaerota archaeon]